MAIYSLDKRFNKREHIYYSFLLIIILSLFAGFRFFVGNDYISYITHYNLSSTIFEFEKKYNSFEYGYELYVSIIKTFFCSSYYLFFSISFFSLLILFDVCRRYSIYPFVSVLLFFAYYYFPQVMGQMRQSFAILITCYSFKYLLERKFLKFTLIICVAMCFHYSAFAIIPLYFLYKINYSKKKVIVFLFISFLCHFYSNQILKLILLLIPTSSFITYSLMSYLKQNNGIFFTLGMIEKIFFFMFYLNCYGNAKMLAINKYSDLFIITYCWGVVLYMMIIGVSDTVASRGVMAYNIVHVFMLPTFITYYKTPLKKLFVVLLILLVSVYMVSRIFMHSEVYFPYKSILDNII